MELRTVTLEEAADLTQAMVDELSLRYEGDAGSPVAPHEFEPPYGLFVVVTEDGRDVGCGGLRLLRDGIGEIKRMYVEPGSRGRGHSRRVLKALVAHARSLGLQEIWLETGTLQPEAMALYASEGFAPIEPYGTYKDELLSRCFALVL
jgi:GNAT superfamily N-acetyltransferase